MIDPNVDPKEGTIEARLVEAIRTVFDPEIPVNVYDLGLIYAIEVEPLGDVRITMTLTSPNCPVAEALPAEVQRKARAVEGVRDASIELTFEPPWGPERLSEAGKLELEFTGYTGPMGGPHGGVTDLTLGRKRVGERPDRRR